VVRKQIFPQLLPSYVDFAFLELSLTLLGSLEGRIFSHLSHFSCEPELPTLKVATVRYAEMLVTFYHMERHHIPGESANLVLLFFISYSSYATLQPIKN